MHFKLYMQQGSWYTLPRYDVSHTFEQYTVFKIDAYNVLSASIFLHQRFYIFKILAHSAWSVDFDELYRNNLCQEAVNNRKDNLGER